MACILIQMTNQTEAWRNLAAVFFFSSLFCRMFRVHTPQKLYSGHNTDQKRATCTFRLQFKLLCRLLYSWVMAIICGYSHPNDKAVHRDVANLAAPLFGGILFRIHSPGPSDDDQLIKNACCGVYQMAFFHKFDRGFCERQVRLLRCEFCWYEIQLAAFEGKMWRKHCTYLRS